MAESTQENKTETTRVKKQPDIRMDDKIPVKSLAPWPTGAARKTSMGDINMPAKGIVYITREEVIAQAQSGNRLLSGTDGYGSHSTWYLDDEYTRKDLGFESAGKPQKFLTIDKVKAIFSESIQTKFEKAVRDNVVTRAEKVFLMDSIKTLNINDYAKIKFCTDYTGNKI